MSTSVCPLLFVPPILATPLAVCDCIFHLFCTVHQNLGQYTKGPRKKNFPRMANYNHTSYHAWSYVCSFPFYSCINYNNQLNKLKPITEAMEVNIWRRNSCIRELIFQSPGAWSWLHADVISLWGKNRMTWSLPVALGVITNPSVLWPFRKSVEDKISLNYKLYMYTNRPTVHAYR